MVKCLKNYAGSVTFSISTRQLRKTPREHFHGSRSVTLVQDNGVGNSGASPRRRPQGTRTHRCCSRYYALSHIDRDRAPTCDVRRASSSSCCSNVCRAQSVLQEVRREEPSITLRSCATKLGLTSLEVIYTPASCFVTALLISHSVCSSPSAIHEAAHQPPSTSIARRGGLLRNEHRR